MPIVQLPSRVPREYTLKINKELKHIKVPITDPREEALEILREQILRLYDGGKTVQDILDLINSGMVIAKNADIIRIIETRDDVSAEIVQDDNPRAKRKSKKSRHEAARDDLGSVEGARRDDSGSTEGARRDELGSDQGMAGAARDAPVEKQTAGTFFIKPDREIL